MNVRYSFALTVFLCSFGLFFLFVFTQAWFKMSQRTCTSFTINLTSTKLFKDALAAKKRSKWIDDFQPVADEDIQVYSAYIEGQAKVRVIGITNDTQADLHCILWYNSSSVTTKLVRAYTVNINENHGKRITAAYFVCYLCGLHKPDAVSIVQTSSLHSPKNILPVHTIHEQNKMQYFTMCLSPMHDFMNESKRLVEWIELNKILGIERFVVYVNSISSDVRTVLDFYSEHDVLFKALPWSLSSFICDGVQIHYCGQLAALNDCLYRSKGYSYFISATDLDEFIIPQSEEDRTLQDMLQRLPYQSAYVFGNSFVTIDTNSNKSETKGANLITDNLMRDDFVYGKGDRSKVIVWTDKAVTFGIHNMWALREGGEYFVDSKIGLLHHFRKESVAYPEGVTVTRFKSKATLKYSRDLRERIELVRKNLIMGYNPSSNNIIYTSI